MDVILKYFLHLTPKQIQQFEAPARIICLMERKN